MEYGEGSKAVGVRQDKG